MLNVKPLSLDVIRKIKNRVGRAATLALIGAAVALSLAACGQTSQEPPSPDRPALVALYDSTDGDGWTNSDNWLTDAPISEWHGVEVDDDRRVIALRLDRNYLVGEIPPELGELSELKTIFLWANYLSGEIPTELAKLAEQCEVAG